MPAGEPIAERPPITFHVRIKGNATGRPSVEADFGRVTVVMGANGCGKTQLLRELAHPALYPNQPLGPEHSRPFDRRPLLYIEGGRVSNPPEQIDPRQMDSQMFQRQPKVTLDSRLDRTIRELLEGQQLNESEYDAALLKWAKEGAVGPKPERGEYKIDNLAALFAEIFRHIGSS